MNKMMCGLVKEKPEIGDYVYHEDLPVPQIKDDEVLVKVHCAAICGTDLHIMEWDAWSQKRMSPPLVPGHEVAGDIVAVGKNVTKYKVGDRVSCETHISCGECWFCKNNMAHICKNVKLYGCIPNSAFAEYTVIPEKTVFKLADDVSYEAGCMFEPMGAGVHGVEAAEVAGKTVLVSGCGPIGLTAVSACKTFGAVKVIACDLIEEKLDLARSMGADHVINSGKTDLVSEVLKLTDGIGVDAAVEITGAQPAIMNALKSVRTAGTMVCVGLPTKPITFEDFTDDLIFREIKLTGVSGRLIWRTWDDFQKVMQSPYYHLEKLIGGHYAMKDFDTALSDIRSGKPGKMLIYPDPSLIPNK